MKRVEALATLFGKFSFIFDFLTCFSHLYVKYIVCFIGNFDLATKVSTAHVHSILLSAFRLVINDDNDNNYNNFFDFETFLQVFIHLEIKK